MSQLKNIFSDYKCETAGVWFEKGFYNRDRLKTEQAARCCVTNWCNQCGGIFPNKVIKKEKAAADFYCK